MKSGNKLTDIATPSVTIAVDSAKTATQQVIDIKKYIYKNTFAELCKIY